MKKIISYILLTAMLILSLSGCGAEGRESANSTNTEETQEAQETDGMSSQEASDSQEDLPEASGILEQGFQDNSMDIYSAAVKAPLSLEERTKDEVAGSIEAFLGVSRAYGIGKHFFEDIEKSWDELSFVSKNGEKGSRRFDREHQMMYLGPVAGTDHYVTLDWKSSDGDGDGEEHQYYLTERDEEHEPLREFQLPFLNEWDRTEELGYIASALSQISHFAVDGSGVVHLMRRKYDGNLLYLLVSPEGGILAEHEFGQEAIGELITLCDGRIIFVETMEDEEGMTSGRMLHYMDAETGKLTTLATIEKNFSVVTLYDENTLLCANDEGVYRSDLSGNDQELLYRWRDHGIEMRVINDIQADEEGNIALVYRDNEEEYNYIYLKPTTEEVEVIELTMAVSPSGASAYKALVTIFNKEYPSCHIELKEDYDTSALLTELIAGKGPVLVDTSLTGFEEQEKLWEPLDAIMEKLGIMDELQPSVMTSGMINGTLYGIVTDFTLRTLVVGDPDLKDWDYDAFLQCVQDKQGLEAIFDNYGGDVGAYFIMNFLGHGIEDTYLLDAEAGTMNFDSSGFRQALEQAKKYCLHEEAVAPGTSLLEGKVLCNEVRINRPEDLALYRTCYGEGANYIGYPTKDGGAHFIESKGSPLAVRRTASEAEKEAAFAFIKLCLSYEGQSQAAKNVGFGLSVRRDVLEKQISSMDENTVAYVNGFDQFRLGDQLNVEVDRKTLLDMVDGARPWKYFPKELREVFFEELDQYFSGTITEDMLIDHLESRVGLYLGERK